MLSLAPQALECAGLPALCFRPRGERLKVAQRFSAGIGINDIFLRGFSGRRADALHAS
jgi:hypothetical protein